MDEMDSSILVNIIKNPRQTLTELGSKLELSEQVIYYRLKNMKFKSIIEKYFLRINYEKLGMKSVYLAFENDAPYPEPVNAKIMCLEKITVYGLSGKEEELNDRIENLCSYLGKPFMRYEAPVSGKKFELSALDKEILDELSKDPLASAVNIADRLERKSSTVKRRIDYMLENGIISIIPKINLRMVNIVLIAIFSSTIEEFSSIIDSRLLIAYSPGSGFAITITDSLESAKKLIDNIRKKDKNAEVMVVYDYDFYP
ncbi:winged helix-turn-helix transcriptional regulator [Ferroplasma acidiphilum]|jgi:DNA-binding Lrp family transcriptional regulator|nr:AsnC family transcriptional regulator [Ferroplasma acidiphilum]MCL4349337.1 Lrp/AsnC family transcriptional regulator [Candidatus Thermoplasmatota archaeon]NOL60055.1 Lrp/AsnC family transcriptional regulator [Ferroplasma acidiphilum]WMT53126.1 MAG: AsnC family transcriptional regulator [Ferroplasma acidiphilum]